MRFGAVPLEEAEGGILAHSLHLPGGRLRKGQVLGLGDIALIRAAGLARVTIARPGPDDIAEDHAATLIATGLGDAPGLSLRPAHAGRVNVLADSAGLVQVSRVAVDAINALDPSITLATLPDMAEVQPRQMVATIKIIPYAAPRASVLAAAGLMAGALTLHPYVPRRAVLIQTSDAGTSPALLDKGQAVIAARLAGLGCVLALALVVPHQEDALADALAGQRASGANDAPDLVLILTASATSDVGDVGPAALRTAGGRVERFGMPVDPGNLLFLGDLGGTPVVGLPGCARSPAPNGADWVLQRLVAGVPVSGADIAAMGVGGLLKEVPGRPQPRVARPAGPARRTEVILLAAGQSSRMRGPDKLLCDAGGQPLLVRAARAALDSGAARVLVALPPGDTARHAALAGLPVVPVPAPHAAEGMAGSLRDALARIGPGCDAVIVALADMPDITPAHYDALIAAHDPEAGHDICRALAQDGTPGHPVMFGRRFFESLSALHGDQGARALITSAPEYLCDVPTPGPGAHTDLDTPEDWADWQARQTPMPGPGN